MIPRTLSKSIKSSIELLEKSQYYESGLQQLQKDFAKATADPNCKLIDIKQFLTDINTNMESLIVVKPEIRSQFNSFKSTVIKPMLEDILSRNQTPNSQDLQVAKTLANIYGATLPSQFLQEQSAEQKADSELKRNTSKPITPETTTQPSIQQTSTQSVAKRPPPPPARSRPAVQTSNVANPASSSVISETPVQHAAKHRGPPPPARNKPKETLQRAGTQQPKTNIAKPSGVAQPAAKTIANQNKENVQPLGNVRSRVQAFEQNKQKLFARSLNAQNVQDAAQQPKKSNQSTTEPIDPATRWNNMRRDAHDRVVNMNDPNYKEPMVYQKGIQKNVSASGPMTRTEWDALKKTTVDKIKSDNFYKQYVKLESESSHTLNLKVGNSQIQQTFNETEKTITTRATPPFTDETLNTIFKQHESTEVMSMKKMDGKFKDPELLFRIYQASLYAGRKIPTTFEMGPNDLKILSNYKPFLDLKKRVDGGFNFIDFVNDNKTFKYGDPIALSIGNKPKLK